MLPPDPNSSNTAVKVLDIDLSRAGPNVVVQNVIGVRVLAQNDTRPPRIAIEVGLLGVQGPAGAGGMQGRNAAAGHAGVTASTARAKHVPTGACHCRSAVCPPWQGDTLVRLAASASIVYYEPGASAYDTFDAFGMAVTRTYYVCTLPSAGIGGVPIGPGLGDLDVSALSSCRAVSGLTASEPNLPNEAFLVEYSASNSRNT